MRPKEILAENLNRLMQARPNLETNLKIVAKSGGRLSNGKLGRIRLGGKTDIETIGELAEVFDLQPWQLLVEDLDPGALPELTTTPLIQQIRRLVATPYSGEIGNSDRDGKALTKVLIDEPTIDQLSKKKRASQGLREFQVTGKGTVNDVDKNRRVSKQRGNKSA